MDMLTLNRVTDSFCLFLHFIYTSACLTLITLSDIAATVVIEGREELVFNYDSSVGHSSVEALCRSCRKTGQLDVNDNDRG